MFLLKKKFQNFCLPTNNFWQESLHFLSTMFYPLIEHQMLNLLNIYLIGNNIFEKMQEIMHTIDAM